MYLVRVVEVQNVATATINLLMTLARSTHHKRSVHMHVMAREIKRDKSLKHDRPARERGSEENKQTRRRAAIRHHIQNSAEAGGLAEIPRRIAVERVEETRHAVEDCAGSGVERHVVEGAEGEDDAHVAWGFIVSALLCAVGYRREMGKVDDIPMMLGQKRKMFS